MFDLLILSLNAAVFLFLVFKTNFIPEYISLLTRGKFQSKLYLETSFLGPRPSYFQFLKDSSPPNFFLNLLSCSLCLGFWISAAICLLVSHLSFIFPVWIISIFIFKLFTVILENLN